MSRTPRLQLLQQLTAAIPGGYSALGRQFGVSGWAVKKWYLSGVVPPERVPALIDLAALHGIKVEPWQIRPDVYPVGMFTRAAQ